MRELWLDFVLRYHPVVNARSTLLMAIGWSVLAPAPVAAAQTLAAQGSWAALKFGDRCEAVARPLEPAVRHQPEARAGFSFTARGSGNGQFHVRLSRVPRAGSSVMLTVGDRPFMLIANADWAWSRGPLQEMAIIETARAATAMRVEGRDGAGRHFTDRYLLDGAPTAIDAAAAGCAARN